MMKRVIMSMVTAALALTLAACGGSDAGTPGETAMTKEEMLAEGMALEEMDAVSAAMEEVPDYLFSSDAQLGIYALYMVYEQNPLAFAENYCNRPYRVTGYVDDIREEGFDLEIEPDVGENMEFQMPVQLVDPEEMLTLQKGERITVVGILKEQEGEDVNYLTVTSAYIAS